MEKSGRKELEEELANLKAELKERELSLPAHSIRPHQLSAIEELESRIRSLEDQLTLLPAHISGE